MSGEVISAVVLGLAWAVAATAGASRSRFGPALGRVVFTLDWTLAAAALGGAVVAAVTSSSWPATVLVWALSALAAGVRARLSAGTLNQASAEGYRLATVMITATTSVVAVVASLWLLSAVLGWPDRLGLIGNIGLITLALVQLAATGRWTGSLLPVSIGAGVIGVSTCLALLVVYLLFGDLTVETLTAGEAFAVAAMGTAGSLVVLPLTVRSVQRRLDLRRPDGQRVLAKIDQLIERRTAIDETLLQSVELLRSSLRLSRAEVWTLTDRRLQLAAADPYEPARDIDIGDAAQRVAAAAGHEGPGTWGRTWIPELYAGGREPVVGAVAYAGSLQGLLVARTDSDHTMLVPELIKDFAHRLGPVMHSASLDASLTQSLTDLQDRERELRKSRERLVSAADTERWRIERDLHDGAQQQLVALGINLRLARGLVSSNPERAQALIDELIDVTRSTTEELRALSHGIYPKVLEDEGIGPALDATARRHTGLEIQVTRSGLDRLPREIEAAVYFSCNEAITNAVKHARSSRIIVSLVAESGELVFEVADDGVGFDVNGQTDHRTGLDNMADRLGAVGGLLTVTSGERGTRIVGVVPLPDQALRWSPR